MALCAGCRRIRVLACQRETSAIVIERRIRKVNRVVAGVASGRETGGDVIGDSPTQTCGAVPFGGMARVAGRAVQAVIVARVALIAIGDHAGRSHLVTTGKSPIGGVAPGSGREQRRGRVAVGAA